MTHKESKAPCLSSDDQDGNTSQMSSLPKRPRTREDFYKFCTYILEYENYERERREEESRTSARTPPPLDSSGSSVNSESATSSGQEEDKPSEDDTVACSKTSEGYKSTIKTIEDIDLREESRKTKMEPPNLYQFNGQPWSSWINILNLSETPDVVDKGITDSRVTKLPRQDMRFFGICPESDRFCAVICSTCGAVVKPQGLKRHVEMKHSGDIESVLLPPPPTPVKKFKTASIKVKNKEAVATATTPTSHSNDSIAIMKQAELASVSAGTSTSTSIVTTKTIPAKISVPLSAVELEPVLNHVSKRKSSSSNSGIDRKVQKVREKDVHESDKLAATTHSCTNEDTPRSGARSPCTRSLLCKPAASTRRTLTGRTKDFNKLVAEHRASKEELQQRGSHESGKFKNPQKAVNLLTCYEDSSGSTSVATGTVQQIVAETAAAPVPVPMSAPAQLIPATSVITITTSTTTTTSSVCTPPSATEAGGGTNVKMPTIQDIPAGGSLLRSSHKLAVRDAAFPPPPLPPPQSLLKNNRDRVKESSRVVSCLLAPSGAVYTLKLAGDPDHPVFKYSIQAKDAAVSASNNVVNFNVNTESLSMVPVPEQQQSQSHGQMLFTVVAQPVVRPVTSPSPLPTQKLTSASAPTSALAPAVQSRPPVRRPVIVKRMPILQQDTNVDGYEDHPKPLVLSTFSGKKVGGSVLFASKKLNVFRNQFKGVITKKAGRPVIEMNEIPVKNIQISPNSMAPSLILAVKPMNTSASANCMFPKTVPNVQTTSMMGHPHRPNILRTTTPKQHVPKILTGLKRPATSSPLAAIDCKHILLKPQNNINVSGIIGKMIVTEPDDGPTSNHLALEKVVPVNIKHGECDYIQWNVKMLVVRVRASELGMYGKGDSQPTVLEYTRSTVLSK